MNKVVFEIDDSTKRATCDETLALCGRYSVEIEPGFDGRGYVVLHDRTPLPAVWPHCPDAERWSPPSAEDGKVFTWARLADGKSELEDGVPTEDGTLDLRDVRLVKTLTKLARVGTVSEVPYSVYAENLHGGMNMVGTGHLRILVSEPYSAEAGKDFTLFKGDRGEKGNTGETGERGPAGIDGMDGRDGRDGLDAFTTYLPEIEPVDGKTFWHRATVAKNPSGNWVLVVDGEGVAGETIGGEPVVVPAGELFRGVEGDFTSVKRLIETVRAMLLAGGGTVKDPYPSMP